MDPAAARTARARPGADGLLGLLVCSSPRRQPAAARPASRWARVGRTARPPRRRDDGISAASPAQGGSATSCSHRPLPRQSPPRGEISGATIERAGPTRQTGAPPWPRGQAAPRAAEPARSGRRANLPSPTSGGHLPRAGSPGSVPRRATRGAPAAVGVVDAMPRALREVTSPASTGLVAGACHAGPARRMVIELLAAFARREKDSLGVRSPGVHTGTRGCSTYRLGYFTRVSRRDPQPSVRTRYCHGGRAVAVARQGRAERNHSKAAAVEDHIATAACGTSGRSNLRSPGWTICWLTAGRNAENDVDEVLASGRTKCESVVGRNVD